MRWELTPQAREILPAQRVQRELWEALSEPHPAQPARVVRLQPPARQVALQSTVRLSPWQTELALPAAPQQRVRSCHAIRAIIKAVPPSARSVPFPTEHARPVPEPPHAALEPVIPDTDQTSALRAPLHA